MEKKRKGSVLRHVSLVLYYSTQNQTTYYVTLIVSKNQKNNGC